MKLFNLFRKKEQVYPIDRVEYRFQTTVDLIRDLDRAEFNRFKQGIELAWQAYQKVKSVQTTSEKELDAVDGLEKSIEELNNA